MALRLKCVCWWWGKYTPEWQNRLSSIKSLGHCGSTPQSNLQEMEIMLTLYKDNTFWCFYGHVVCDFNDFNGIICWWFYFAYLVADAYFGVNVDYNLSIQFNTKRLSFVCFCLLAMLLLVSVEYFLTKQCWRSLGNIRPGPKGWNRISLFTYAKNWMVFFKSNFRIPPFSFDIDFKQHCFPIDKTLYSSGFCKKRYFGGW